MWAQIINTIIGLWVMIAPGVLGYGSAASDNGHIVGPIIVTFSITAIWEATRGMRKANYPFAIWLLIAPWILNYNSDVAIISDMLSGILVIIFSSFEGKITQSFGGGWASLWKDHPEHLQKANK
ncbi:SPW repeat domain-containing protein [Salinimicrobium soli]|uniref:SPW repeat domain-containing protein n=1 Tax=Salinimicrobium soli TaxID=1254399 RepID=UPI003AB07867